jgi:tetratricopeptide (TPR) repeat protein
MRATLRWLLVLGCFLGVFAPADGWADRSLARPTKQEAREHMVQGNRFYNRARWEDAIREYKAGAQVEDVPAFDYNIAQTLRMRGDYQDSLLYYERFLDRGQPTGEVLEAVHGFIAEMRAQLANRARSMPPTEPAKSPDETPPVHTSRGGAEPQPDSLSAVPRAVHSPPSTEERRESTSWLGWTTAGVGLAAIGVSGYLLLRGANLNDESDGEADARKRAVLREDAKTHTLVGAVTGIGGLALTLTGVVLLATHGHDRARRDTPAVSLGFTPHGVLVLGRF